MSLCRLFLGIAVFALATVVSSASHAETLRGPVEAAERFLKLIEANEISTAYEELGRQFQANVDQHTFADQFGAFSLQLGTRRSTRVPEKSALPDLISRRLLDAYPVEFVPNALPGRPYYLCEFISQYPHGSAWQQIFLELEPDRQWRVVGAWFKPGY